MNEPTASAPKNEEKDEEEVDLCPICSLPSISSCRNCKKIGYCSKPHQRAHWKVHKQDCFPLIHQYDPILGSRLLTTRSVKAGEVIWREKSLLFGPCHLQKQCLVCLAVKSNYDSHCPSCGLPLCDKESCNKRHVGSAECKIFTQNKPKSSKDVFIARALLLKKEEPSSWRKLLEMDEMHGEHNFSEQAEYFMNPNLFNGSDQEVRLVERLLRAKVFETRNSRQLYFTASQGATLSCVPNCSWIIQEEEEEALEIQLRANIPIQFGRTVSICKGDASLGLIRRLEFCGECERCKSPNELDTFYSGIKCPECEHCVMTLVFEKKERKKVSWSCAECGVVKDWQFYEQLVDEIKKEIFSVLSMNKNVISKLKEIGEKFSESKVHPNHFVIFGIELEILKRISQQLKLKESVESEEEWVGFVETFVALGRKWLGIGDVLWPGLTGQRGELLYYYQQALSYQTLLTISQNMRCSDSDLELEAKELASIRQSQLETQFHKIISIRRLILQIFCYHPKSSVEGKFAEEMAQIYCPEIEVLKYYVFLRKNKQSVL